jgi:hypothetical protein
LKKVRKALYNYADEITYYTEASKIMYEVFFATRQENPTHQLTLTKNSGIFL